MLWKIKTHDKVKMLLWRIGSNVLSMKANLMSRVGNSNLNCVCYVVEKLKYESIYILIARKQWPFGLDAIGA